MALRERLSNLTLDRRKLLVGAAAGGGLLVAWWAWPRRYDSPLQPEEGEQAFGGWLTIGRDGVVTVAVPQLEMGQGVTTLLPQVVAVELGADWRQIAVEPVPPGGLYANLPLAAKWAPLWSSVPALATAPDSLLVRNFARGHEFVATAEGLSLDAYEGPCRAAAAAARAMLTEAAAERWDVAPEECEAADGFIIHGDRRLRFGELAQEAATLDPPDPPPLRPQPAFEWPIEGGEDAPIPFPRLDLPAKVDGSFLYAADVRLPGMVYASIRHGPVSDSALARFDGRAVKGLRGLVGVVKGKRWIAAVAESWWIADRALQRMNPIFTGPRPPDSASIAGALDAAIRGDTFARITTIGDPDSELEKPSLVRRYDVAPAVHAAMETASCTARLAGGRLEIWIASQAPEAVRVAVAKAVDLSPRDVVLYPMGAGGSFDARLEKAHAIEAAVIAQEINRPVQLTWSRPQEMQAVPPRTPVTALMSARTAGGLPVAWRAKLALPATVREFGLRLFDNLTSEAALERIAGAADPLACEGAVPPYTVPNIAIDHAPADIGLPTGRLRGNAVAYTAFFTESFVDELASAAGQDGFLYRMGLLGNAPRMAECLRLAARLGEWDGGRPGSGQGIAMVRMGEDADGGGRIACVAQAGLADGGVRVTRLSAAVDIGRIVNLDIARQQIEGGLIFGAALAMGGAVRFANGKPQPQTLGALNLPSLATAPEIVIDFIASEAPPADPGELGVAVAAPAIANALHSATGRRFRRLPLLWEGP